MAKMVAVEQLVPGDILSDAVLSMSGKVLLGKDIELTARHISLLNTWDIKNVFVDMLPEAEPAAVEPISAEQEMIGAGDVEYTMSKEYAMFAQQYDGIVTNTVQSFDIIRQQRIIPVAHLKNTAGGIYSSIDSNGLEMMNYLLAEDEQIADVISRHAVMVAYFSSIIARQLKWEEKDIVGVALASLLHDIGDLVTSDSKRQLHLAETAGLLKMAVGVPAEV
ncbi:MAG: HD domain-containing protein, partial [Selenomonadaceae bacterium]